LSRAALDGEGEGEALRARCAGEQGEDAMLRIHDVMLETIRCMRPMITAIERSDTNLAKQLKASASSVTLNIAEGSGSFGGTRRERYRSALGSARETLSNLRTAEAFGYVCALPEEVVVGMNRVIGTLVRVAR
jgi:four helix bundle protein